MQTNVLIARKPVEGLFCKVGIEVSGLIMVFKVKFGFKTGIWVSPQMTGINNNIQAEQ